ncbi:uncharacterized protein AC631_02461 [Debaryomyces fabryi]|uniref:tRNA pseudouridine(55) synthase n=1 Tax=Debaryomyces fabryi TaxID=58627 RepID=A0A0V1PZT5_9ASCO|nr:uncharacterized protein AC631_02461 [Debaryomyces fabryi]KSA01780.1 hypothetical protein AC631_02461 [Debaryomyces fabryi]CUM46318.1 unnamed protein product [Debaryomyces fabryi]
MFKYKPRSMNGVFAIEKPSGITSSKFIGDIQAIFTKSEIFQNDLIEARNKAAQALGTDKKWSKERINKRVKSLKVKIGHGGTLDPMASGVLVVGVGLGTKKLQYYLSECNKTYETKALLGISTTTGDAEGEIITKNQVSHITKEMIKETAPKFIGDLKQTPPIFSALKMNGKPLYDYAREGIPLPMPIKVRQVKVFDIKVHDEDSLRIDHGFSTLQSELDEQGNPKEHELSNNPTLNDSPLYFSDQYLSKAEAEGLPKEVGKPKPVSDGFLPEKLPLIHLTADVSSGTYIRSLVSDYGRALESSAYMVELIRVRQSEWQLGKNVFKISDFENRDERIWGPVLKRVLDSDHDIDVQKELDEFSDKIAPLLNREKEVIEKFGDVSKEDVDSSEKSEILPTTETKAEKSTELPKKRTIDEIEK